MENKIWSKKTRWVISVIFAVIFVFVSGNDDSIDSTSADIYSVETIEGTEKCLVNTDLEYPSKSNIMGAFKFSSDGTFNSSSTMFGGMTTWGNWSVSRPGMIRLRYTRSTTGNIPNNRTITLKNRSSLLVGSTEYTK